MDRRRRPPPRTYAPRRTSSHSCVRCARACSTAGLLVLCMLLSSTPRHTSGARNSLLAGCILALYCGSIHSLGSKGHRGTEREISGPWHGRQQRAGVGFSPFWNKKSERGGRARARTAVESARRRTGGGGRGKKRRCSARGPEGEDGLDGGVRTWGAAGSGQRGREYNKANHWALNRGPRPRPGARHGERRVEGTGGSR